MQEKDKKVNIFKNIYFLLFVKILLTALVLVATFFCGLYSLIFMVFGGIWKISTFISLLIIPLILPFIWLENKNRKKYLTVFVSLILVDGILFGTQAGIRAYNNAVTIDVTPAIKVHEYMPFDEKSKIVQIKSETFKFDESKDIPII